MWLSWLIVLSSLLTNGVPYSAGMPIQTQYIQESSQWSLEGIELGNNDIQVIKAWGPPIKVEADEWQLDCETWSFREGKNLGMCEGQVFFVQITAHSNKTNIDGKAVSMDAVQLRQILGSPEFEAEDGWGFLRGNEALKIFVDEQGSIVSIDLFSDSNSG